MFEDQVRTFDLPFLAGATDRVGGNPLRSLLTTDFTSKQTTHILEYYTKLQSEALADPCRIVSHVREVNEANHSLLAEMEHVLDPINCSTIPVL